MRLKGCKRAELLGAGGSGCRPSGWKVGRGGPSKHGGTASKCVGGDGALPVIHPINSIINTQHGATVQYALAAATRYSFVSADIYLKTAGAAGAAAGAAGFSFRYRPSWASPYGRKVRLYPNPEASTWAECALFHGIA